LSQIADRVESIRRRIRRAAERSGRDPECISIVAVTKNVEIDSIREAVRAGVSILGENRVQEAKAKAAAVGTEVGGEKVSWHLVGHLQRNKARPALEIFSLIHSLDSWRLACELERVAERLDVVQECLLQINVSRESTKYGVDPDDAVDLGRQIAGLERIKLAGIMAIAPVVETADEARPYFRMAKEICDRIACEGIFCGGRVHLSMGMTWDFEVAVEEGATMVRIGTGIFGPR